MPSRRGCSVSSQVLIIEDDASVRELLAFHLSQAGFHVTEAGGAEEAWDKLSEVDVVVLDWMLPDESGIDWLARLRRQTKGERMPVLMLTARASEMDRVRGLDGGADDYLVKPFSAAELVARLRALLRRSSADQQRRVGALMVDEVQGVVTLKGERLMLTRREFELIAFLSAHPGRVFTRSELLDFVWGEDFLGTERTVDQHIAQLRSRIGPEWIETIRGRGYRLIEIEEA